MRLDKLIKGNLLETVIISNWNQVIDGIPIRKGAKFGARCFLPHEYTITIGYKDKERKKPVMVTLTDSELRQGKAWKKE